MDQSRNHSETNGHKVLVVTRANLRTPRWVDRAEKAKQGLSMWREHRHQYVFADMGDLGDGLTGARLSMSLRKETHGDAPIIVMLCDSIAEHNLQRAKLSGANSVVRREEAAIAAALPPEPEHMRGKESTWLSVSEFPPAEVQQSIVALVETRLQRIARMGPVRSMVVADAIEALKARNGGLAPTLDELVQRVSAEISAAADRAAFLQSFKG